MVLEFKEFIDPDADLVQSLRDNLKAFNETTLGKYDAKPLMVTAARDDGSLAGGAYGWLQFGWLYIHLVWVDEACRRQKLGTRLMERIEAMARAHGVTRSRLATSDFQPGFHLYRHRGYEVFAEVPFSSGDPEGRDNHIEYMMWKICP